MSEKKTKPELLYITNPNCGWCKKADPVVKTLIEEGYKIVTLDMSKPEEAKKANEVKAKFNASCGTPLFIDSSDGNMVCGFNEDNVKKWVDGEKIPPPPPRKPHPPQQPQNRPGAPVQSTEKMEFAFSVWQEAKQALQDKYYADFEVWNNWNFSDNNMVGECPIKERPEFPTTVQITVEAQKLFHFCATK